jgi:hypothetical protein
MVTPAKSDRWSRVAFLVAGLAVVAAACGTGEATPSGDTASENTVAETVEPASDDTRTTATPTTSGSAPTTTAADAVAIAPPIWLSQFADYPRYLWHKRRLAIATTNGGDEAIEVTSIVLRADHFLPLAAERKSSTIPPGTRVDLQVDFGELVDCTTATPLRASVDIAFRIGEEATPTLYTAAIDPAPLDDIRDTECDRLAVTDAVDIGFGDNWELDGETIAAEIVLDRITGDEVVHVDSLRGTEIFVMQPDPPTDEVDVTLDPGEASVAIPVELRVLRCDPHAVGQSTRTFEFKIWVAVGDRDTQLIVLDPDERLRGGLAEILTLCLEASS